MEQDEKERQAALARVKQEAKKGFDQIDAGKSETFDTEEKLHSFMENSGKSRPTE